MSAVLVSAPSEIAATLHAGGVVGYPTESVFGLGCDPGNADAIARVHALKARDARQGFLIIGAEFGHVERYIDMSATPRAAIDAAMASWPGPFTWVFPSSKTVPAWLVGEHNGVAVRVTAHAPAAQICRAFGGSLVSTSANPHGFAPAMTAREVVAYFPTGLDAVLDAAVGGSPRPSTIIDALTGAVVRP